MSWVVYQCEKCNKVYSIRKGDNVGRCPNCNALSMYQIPLDEEED